MVVQEDTVNFVKFVGFFSCYKPWRTFDFVKCFIKQKNLVCGGWKIVVVSSQQELGLNSVVANTFELQDGAHWSNMQNYNCSLNTALNVLYVNEVVPNNEIVISYEEFEHLYYMAFS